MEPNFQLCFDSEYPDIGAFESFVQEALVLNQINDRYMVQDIIDQACQHCEASSTDTIVEIQLALLKITCLEIIQLLSQANNKDKFDQAVAALSSSKNPAANKFFATIHRLLYQYRLSKAYEPREIVAEAYLRGVQYMIRSGNPIQSPEAWLRRTCHNVIRELQYKQKQAQKPNFDSELWSPGDQALCDLMLREDYESARLAKEQLNREECEILTLRVDQKLTWQAIGAMLLNAEGSPLGENAARQRGFRAFLKLRQHYNAIREDVRTPEDD